MQLEPAPESLTCSACGEEVAEVGYLPAIETDGPYEPIVEAAVCGACGFNEIGMMGCAPELGEVVERGSADVLLFVRPSAGGIEVVSAKP